MLNDGSFPALERLKTEAEGLEVLIEHAPSGTGPFIEWLFEIDYLDRKQAILDQRASVRETYTTHLNRIEQAYGTTVVNVLERRNDGDMPRFDTTRVQTELEDAASTLDDLYRNVDKEYLTQPERKRLSDVTEDVTDAREYIQNKIEFDQRREALNPKIDTFEAVFEPYSGATRYMITSDQEQLCELSYELWTELASMARELVLPVLPDDDADWLAEQKTRFGSLADYLPEYNDEFVKNEREEYADLLETEHGPLNEQQQKAVIRNNRRNIVDASAGTGKTLTLTRRFIYLLAKDVPVDSIVAITYTNEAANEMKGRIAKATGVDESELNISTIHSFANHIYQDAESGSISVGEDRTQLVESYYNAAVGDGNVSEDSVLHSDCYQEFKRAYSSFLKVEANHGDEGYVADKAPFNKDRNEFTIDKLDEFVTNARKFGLSAGEIRGKLDGTSELRDTFGAAGAALVEAYNRIVDDQRGPTDFTDMIETATAIIESNPDRFGNRYSHILIDEFQDVTNSTLRFAEAFMTEDTDTHLFCVGDDWQGIYGFAGSNIRYFTEYQDRFDDVTYTQLEINYRCPPVVVEAGSKLMEQSNAPQNNKSVVAHSDLDTTPQVHELDTLYDERVVPYVADMIESQLSDTGRDLDEILVVSRNDSGSDYMTALREELQERKIPHERPKYENDFLPNEYVSDLPFEIQFDEKGYVEYDVPAGVESPDESPPIVRMQSVHSSKGTEAPVVILLHAVDDDKDGIPSKRRTDKLLQPSIEITAEHIPEERRLFYVALTRTEEEFYAVTQSGNESRYLSDIRSYFRWKKIPFPDEIVGRCVSFNEPYQDNYPIKAELECEEFTIPLLAWPNQNPPRLEEGSIYKLKITDTDRQINENEYGTEIRFDRTPIEEVQKPT